MRNKPTNQSKIFLFLAASITLFLYSCMPGAEESGSASRPDSSEIISPGTSDTAFISLPDTIAPPGIPRSSDIIVPEKTEGSVVYYLPARMIENTDNNISVTITKASVEAAIKQLLQKVAATTGKPEERIQQDINSSDITISPKMKVELKYSDQVFESVYKPENDDQLFDGINDMNWDWIIKPLKVGNLQLSIVISAYNEKKGRWMPAQTPPKIFTVKVQVDPRGYFAKLWGFLEANPEWLLLQVIFPVLAFFVGRKAGKKTT